MKEMNSFNRILQAVNASITVDSRYLDFGYLEQPLISKNKPGPCSNIEIWYQVTKNCG